VSHVGRLFPLSLDPVTSPACATELPVLQGDNDVVGAHVLLPNPLHHGSVHYRSDSDWQDDCDVFRQIAASVLLG
jgi:hypothetical protein